MKVIQEKKEIFGELHTSFGVFYLLSPQPNIHDIPFGLLRERGFLSFHVMEKGGDGVGKHIYYKSDEILIVPFSFPTELPVNFVLEDDENIKVEESEELPF